MKNLSAALVISLCLAASLSSCGPQKPKIDLSSTHTTASKETMAATTAAPAGTTASATVKASEDEKITSGTKAAQTAPVSRVVTSIHTYTSGTVSVEYPAVSGLSSESIQNAVNQRLSENALSIIKAYGMDESKDSLSVKCKVISADRKKVVASYTGIYTASGSPYPVNIFYSNTVDTAHGKDMGFMDYADPYTLAGYVLSGDCRFYNADPELKDALTAEKNKLTIEEYTDLFRHADFSYQNSGDSADSPAGSQSLSFPKVFSYEDQGTIYVSIPVPHALGDYALIQYIPEGK